VGRTFNNRPLPSDDYWCIKLEDGREAKGHRPSSDNQFAKTESFNLYNEYT
jgi:hypothetical protein